MRASDAGRSGVAPISVKHLNPRQGITTRFSNGTVLLRRGGVKHLNPRQGITMERPACTLPVDHTIWCETPKSPPGDYNSHNVQKILNDMIKGGVKHLNPRQGITT